MSSSDQTSTYPHGNALSPGARAAEEKEVKARTVAFTRWIVAALMLALLALVIGGWWFHRAQKQSVLREVEKNLSAIANLKAGQIAAWRRERLGDATVLAENPFFIQGVSRFINSENEEARQQIVACLDSLKQNYHSADMLLVDAQGRQRLSLNGNHGLYDGYQAALVAAFREDRALIIDLHTGPAHHAPHISVMAPLFGNAGDLRQPLGALIMVIDAAQFLYPLIQSWPVDSRTAETLLIRRDGDDVLFLNDLRHQADTALKLRIPMRRKDLPASMAVSGRKGIVMGIDYRGVEVLSAILPVPDSPWFMVAKVDADEILSDWRIRSALIVAVVLALTFFSAVTALLLWQREKKRQYRMLYLSEAFLRDSLERHSVTLKSIGDAVIATDANGMVELLNPVAEALTGWTEAEARGRPLDEVFHIVREQTLETVEDPVSKVLREGAVVGLANHTVLVAKNGKRCPIADSGAPIRDENGRIIGVVLVFRDQTEERRNQRMSEIRWHLIDYAAVHGLKDLMTHVLDEIDGFLDSPIGFLHFVDTDQQSISLQQWSTRTQAEFCHARGEQRHYPLAQAGVWADCARLGKPVVHNDYPSLSNRKGMPDGHAPIIRELVVPVMREDKVVAILGVGNKPYDYTEQDVEALVYLADMIWEIIEHKRVEEENTQLQAQLAQAQKMEAIGRLAGGVAHDYNNMLSVILGYTELAIEKTDPSEALFADLNEILSAARRSTDITRQLLAFARKQTIEPRVLDLNRIVEGMLKMLRRLIGEDIDLAWRPAATIWPVKMDPSQIEQVLANLCVNARDAIDGVGKITIETGTVALDDAYCAEHAGFIPGEFVLLAVSDDGCGMDQETLASIFEPFFTTKDEDQGTGLGLATVYGIVKQNEGFINVYSEPGQGTTLKIYLARHADEDDLPITEMAAKTEAGGNETVLFVEDEPSIRKMGKSMLRRLGYTVLVAGSPEEAIQLAAQHPHGIDLMITDVVMPGMNGRELADRLQSLYPGLKILFMSGYTANVIAHRGVLDEGVQFIHKPFSKKDLNLKIREILDAEKGMQKNEDG